MTYYGLPLLIGAALAAFLNVLAVVMLEPSAAQGFHEPKMIYLFAGIPVGWTVISRFGHLLKGGNRGTLHPALKIIFFPVILIYWYLKGIGSMVIGMFAGPFYLLRFIMAAAAACLPQRSESRAEVEDVDPASKRYKERAEQNTIGFTTTHND